MIETSLSPAEIVRRGEELYDRQIRKKVDKPENKGLFLVLDTVSGEYEIDADDLTAEERLLSRIPDAIPYGLRIGYRGAYKLGRRLQTVIKI